MSDVTLSPSDPLLRHLLERYAETLEGRGLDVDLERPREERGMTPESAFVSLAIGIAGNVIGQEWPWMKEKLREWFTELPRREKRRVIEVRVEDDAGQLYEQFSLEDE